MDQLHIPYSLKAIAHPPRALYQKLLVKSVSDFMTNLRWKVISILRPFQSNTKKTFGFKTSNSPPFVPELKSFEEELLSLVSHVKYRPVSNDFQRQLKDDRDKILRSKEVIVLADKSQNIYKMPPEVYKKKMVECISTTYKKCPPNTALKVTKEAAKIARSYGLEDRIDIPTEEEAFLLIKDHKESFPGRIECRVINPAKNWIGVISKSILDRVNRILRSTTQCNSWLSTGAAINWFKSIPNKQAKSFIKFDIVSFYPSITEDLLLSAVSWARTITSLSEEEYSVIRHCRRNFLFFQNETWVKRDNADFDVGMGAPDSAEISELCGLYLLFKMEKLIPKEQLGLYRDDGLAVVELPGPEIERLRKRIISLFSEHKLKITTDANIKTTDFLDVQFCLATGSHKPFKKDSCQPLYVPYLSNHPRHVKKEIPKMISKRISDLSSSKEIFASVAPFYNQALRVAGYKEELQFQEPCSNIRRRRRRKTVWFNPPFNDEVSTNIARKFLSMISRHFPKGSPLGKILNKNSVKVSYRTCPNLKSTISGHNKRILGSKQQPVEKGCNCRVARDCPLDGKCLTSDLVYRNTVHSTDGQREYIGLTANSFKTRFATHKSSFNHANKSTSTALSSYIWSLKNENTPFTTNWSILSLAPSYSKKTRSCQLCLSEKTLISLADPSKSLNKRSEIISKCRHKDKILLRNY